MQRNKYLDDLGIKPENYGGNFIKGRKLQRFLERRRYGFDYRETVNMDLAFAEWLYSRLMMLMEQTMDDLTFNSVVFEGAEYTIKQAIRRILKATRNYLYFYEVEDSNEEKVDEQKILKICDEMKSAVRLWAEVMVYADRVVVSKKMLCRLKKGEL